MSEWPGKEPKEPMGFRLMGEPWARKKSQRWVILRWMATQKRYDVVATVEAAHAPAALLAGPWKSDPLCIARLVDDYTIPR